MEPQYATIADLSRLADKLRELVNNSVSLRDYVDVRFLAMETHTNKTREAMEYRLEGMNEFRESLRDTQSHFVTKSECLTGRTQIDEAGRRHEDEIKSLQLTRAEMSGKASKAQAMTAIVIAVAGIMIGIAGIVMSIVLR